MLTHPQEIPESSHPEARRKNMLTEQDLSPYFIIRDTCRPAMAQDGTLMWRHADIERLRTRKAWKKRGRRIRSGTEPQRIFTQEDGGRVRLFAHHQTISQEDFQAYQKKRLTELVTAWKASWQALEQRLAAWTESLLEREPSDAEMELQEILEQRHRALQHQDSLDTSLRSFDQHLPPPSLTIWKETLEHYRAYRFKALLRDAPHVDPEIAEQANLQLVTEELKERDPLAITPYWTFFGRFHKALESARFELDIAEATRIREFHALFPARNMFRHFISSFYPLSWPHQLRQDLSGAATSGQG